MKIFKKITGIWDGERYVATDFEVFEYEGPIAECKGDHSQDEQKAADQTRQQQFDLMQKQLASVNKVLDPLIAAGGMTPQQQAALTSIALNDIPQQFQGIQGNINQQLVARGITGGGMAGSGDVARNFAGLEAMEGGLQQADMNQIQLQKQQQLMEALGIKGGMMNTFNQGGLTALGSGVTAANNADQAQTSAFGAIMGAVGSLGGSALTGGLGLLKPPAQTPCWIARAVLRRSRSASAASPRTPTRTR